MNHEIHRRKRHARKFQPMGMDALEDRTVLSAGMTSSTHTLAAAQVGTGQNSNQNTNQTQQVPLVNQVLQQINQQFAQFATQYYQLQSAYFDSLGSNPSSSAIDLNTFQTQVGTLVGNLTQQVLGTIDAVPGGGGILDAFVQRRLNSDEPGSLRHELMSMPAVGTAGLDQAGFGLTASTILQDSATDIQNFTRLYDQGLAFAVNGFFNGSLRFFNTSNFASDLPQQSSNTLGAADQVINSVNRYFSNFAYAYQSALSTYLGSVNTGNFGSAGDIQSFRDTISVAAKNLETDVLNAVNAAPGGAGPLTSFLDSRLNSTTPGSLAYDLMNLPPVGTAGLSPSGFALTGDTVIRNVLGSTQNSIRLYDSSLNYVANGFFNAYSSRYIRNNPTTGTGGTTTTIGANPSTVQVARAQSNAAAGQVHTMAFLPSGPFTQGNYNYSTGGLGLGTGGLGGFGTGIGTTTGGFFNSAPSTYNPYNGFGGLGSGFNFGGTGFPFNGTNYGFGTGFGTFGSNVNRGYTNPLLGTNPMYGTGFGTSYGVVGPSFTSGFSGLGTPGAGFGYGVTPSYGGFYF